MSFRRGLAFSFGRSGGQFAVQFISNVVLARLLLPSEIGVFAVAVAATTIMHALRDFGIGRYLVKEHEITREKVRTVFGVGLVIGTVLACTTYLLSAPIATFYGEPLVGDILRLLSINFLLLPLGQPALALLRRERRFERVVTISMVAIIGGAATSISSAAAGLGPLGLAYGSIMQNLLISGLSLQARPDHLRMLPSFSEWRSVCGFGGYVTVATSIMELGAHAPDLIIGRALGFTHVGLYSRGFGLAQAFERVVLGALSWVMGPELATRRRAGSSLRSPTMVATSYTTALGWPALTLLAFKAETVVWLLYGENWLGVVPILQILCGARMIHLVGGQAAALYEATGDARLQLKNTLLVQGVSIALLFLAAAHSLEAVAWSRVATGVVFVLVQLSVFRRHAEIGLTAILMALTRSLFVAIFFLVIVSVVCALEPDGWSRSTSALLIEGVALVAGYVAIVHLVRHPLANELTRLGRSVHAWSQR